LRNNRLFLALLRNKSVAPDIAAALKIVYNYEKKQISGILFF